MSDIYFVISQCKLTGGLQLTIEDQNGGYRLLGPHFVGKSEVLKKCKLDQRDVKEIRAYLRKVK